MLRLAREPRMRVSLLFGGAGGGWLDDGLKGEVVWVPKWKMLVNFPFCWVPCDACLGESGGGCWVLRGGRFMGERSRGIGSLGSQ